MFSPLPSTFLSTQFKTIPSSSSLPLLFLLSKPLSLFRTLFLCNSFPFFSPPLSSGFLMELPWLNRLRLLTRLSKKKRMGSTERIADAAILAGDVLIERFIGSVGDGHIKEQQLIRTPSPRLSLIYSILVSYLFLYIYLVCVKGPEWNMNRLLRHFLFTASC